MIPRHQTKTVAQHGWGDCTNACIASILELPLSACSSIKVSDKGNTNRQWREWLADKGYKLTQHLAGDADDILPPGYSIATVTTERRYPLGHQKQGEPIFHAVVALDGIVVHDPFPGGSAIEKIYYYQTIDPLDPEEYDLLVQGMEKLVCGHGYRQTCVVCERYNALGMDHLS